MRRSAIVSMLFATLGAAATAAGAGEAVVVDVRATGQADGRYRFDVAVRHADSGWDHFADRWDVIGPDGTVLATRVLAHPHVDEQPFTRSLLGVRIPEAISEVRVRAHDSVHGLSGKAFTVALPGR